MADCFHRAAICSVVGVSSHSRATNERSNARYVARSAEFHRVESGASRKISTSTNFWSIYVNSVGSIRAQIAVPTAIHSCVQNARIATWLSYFRS